MSGLLRLLRLLRQVTDDISPTTACCRVHSQYFTRGRQRFSCAAGLRAATRRREELLSPCFLDGEACVFVGIVGVRHVHQICRAAIVSATAAAAPTVQATSLSPPFRLTARRAGETFPGPLATCDVSVVLPKMRRTACHDVRWHLLLWIVRTVGLRVVRAVRERLLLERLLLRVLRTHYSRVSSRLVRGWERWRGRCGELRWRRFPGRLACALVPVVHNPTCRICTSDPARR